MLIILIQFITHFSHYIQSSDQEKVHVNWGVDTLHEKMSANLHIRVIHASIVLLTCTSLPGMFVTSGFSAY